jgi:hypothetical protein
MALLCAAPLLAAELPARHRHWRGGCDGVLAAGAGGVSFRAKKHAWSWTWDDIQQLTAADREIRVVPYRDRLLRLGADEEGRFTLLPGANARNIEPLLREKLGRKFVAAVAENASGFEIPAKLLGAIRGVPGVLVFAPGELVFRSPAAGKSRTWLLADIGNISRTGPYAFTVVTFERGREFNFQLKRPLPDAQYEALWQRLNQNQGLRILTSYKEKEK